MNSRERLQATLNHQPVDRLCVDFGAGYQTGICAESLYRLRQAVLGEDPDFRVKITEPYQMLGEIDEPLRRALRLDAVGVHGPGTMFGFATNTEYKQLDLMDGTPVMVPQDFNVTEAPDGGWHMHAGGDVSQPVRGHMPKDGHFFDTIIKQDPIDEDKLDPADNCEEFGPMDEADLRYMADAAQRYAEQTEYGIYMTLPDCAFGDIALVPAPWMAHPRGIRDVEEWYVSTAIRRDYIRAIFDCQLEYALRHIDLLAEAVGPNADVVFVSGTDFGAQHGPFLSVDTYRDLYKPYHVAVNQRIHEKTPWKTFIHTDGSIRDLIPEFIDAGFDVLNPVQWTCAGMDAAELKKEFGQDLVFWGGGIDAQHTLVLGSADDVYNEARRMIDIFFADGTGYVFNGMHNVQAGVPTENLLALFRAVDDARGG